MVPDQYSGVVFDVEIVQGSSAETIPLFAKAFEVCKGLGLTVVVTTSHSAPYMTDTPQDAVEIVKAWAADDNVDMLSPQLYSSGMEGSPEFAESNNCKEAGCTWELYQNSKAKFVPSIVTYSHYPAVQEYFSSKYNITNHGFIQWAQDMNSNAVAFYKPAQSIPGLILQ